MKRARFSASKRASFGALAGAQRGRLTTSEVGRSLSSKSSMYPRPLVLRLGRLCATSASKVTSEGTAVLISGSISTTRVRCGTSLRTRKSKFHITVRFGSLPTRTRRSLERSLL